MKYYLCVFMCLSLYGQSLFSQNVGIGTATPHASAQLEISSTDKGVLVPRLALSAANLAAPVSSPADALLIFNTATAGEGANAVSPGYYYWSASASRWIGITGSASAGGDIGFGPWGDCSVTAISEYQPAVASDGRRGDVFGVTVSMSGNFAIIGAPFDTIGANGQQGSAYIFSFNGTTWVQQQKLLASDGAAEDWFGYSLSISGNYAIVGAPGDNNGAVSNQGSAYVFFYNGSTWVQQQKLTASDGLADDLFGISEAITASYALVGAKDDDISTNQGQGSAYIFHNNAGTWVQQPRLTANDGAANDNFGYSVALSGNYAVIGSIFDSPLGSAYVFFYNGVSWVQQQKLLPTDPASGFFGTSVSISGNYIFVGAETTTIGSNNAQGAAYIYYFNGVNWDQQQQLLAADGAINDRFGKNVSVSGNYALISSPQADIGASIDQGCTYLYQNAGGFWIRRQKIINPTGGPLEYSGTCSVSDGRFVIGNGAFSLRRGQVMFGKIN